MKFFKNNFKFIVVFFLILVFNLICNSINLDEVWNYGFSNNLYRGLVPYVDFNMVLTPIYPFIMSLPFYLFGSSMLVFHITNSLMITLTFVLLYKMFGNKSYLILFFATFPLNFTFPNYNLFLFMILVLLIYLETNYKSNKNFKYMDYLIGFILGIGVLTKQTVGVFLILPSLYYLKDLKLLFKRFIGFIIPIGIFIIYLIVNKAFLKFLDLCLFGLIDFSSNSHGVNFNFIVFLILVCFIIYRIIKDRSNLVNYYVLSFSTIAIPIMDNLHLAYLVLGVLLIILPLMKRDIINYKFFSISCIIILGIVTLNFNKGIPFTNFPNDLEHFEYRFINEESYNITVDILKFFKENKDENIIILNANAYYFKIIMNLNCDYLDLINRGNWGYNGSDKLLKRVKEEASNGSMFLILTEDVTTDETQTDKRAISYVVENGKKIKTIGIFDVYKF